MSKVSKQYKSEDGEIITHTEARSRKLEPSRVVADMGPDIGFMWENDVYYGTLRTYKTGCALTGGAWAVIGITAKDESARHDWREFQQIKNSLLGDEWEVVEIYPAESRLKDPSNRFYLWCSPCGAFSRIGFQIRSVVDMPESQAPQRPFPKQS